MWRGNGGGGVVRKMRESIGRGERIQKLLQGVIVPIHPAKWYNLSIRVIAKTSYFRINTQETKRLKILMFSLFVIKNIQDGSESMKEIICTGIILLLTGCGLAISGGQTADSIAEGWYSPQKTDLQLSQDRDQCGARCVTA
jgi:hypothetical protein